MATPPLSSPLTGAEQGLRGLVVATLALGAVAVAAVGLISNIWGYIGAQERLLLHHMMSILFSGFMACVTILITAIIFYRHVKKYRGHLSAIGAGVFLYSVYRAAMYFDQFTQIGIPLEEAAWGELYSLLPIFIIQFVVITFIIIFGISGMIKARTRPKKS